MAFEPDPRIAEALARLHTLPAPTDAWKHTFIGQPPTAPNTRGARWNPPETPAIYLALDRDTALAEGQHLVRQQPQPIRRGRTLHHLSIAGLKNVLDLRDRRVLKRLGVGDAELAARTFAACQRVGGTAESSGYDGIVVPSARSDGFNLVIFERKAGEDLQFTDLGAEPI